MVVRKFNFKGIIFITLTLATLIELLMIKCTNLDNIEILGFMMLVHPILFITSSSIKFKTKKIVSSRQANKTI